MSPGTKLFLQRWAITALAVLVAAHLVDGIQFDDFLSLLIASLVLGVLNAFLRPLMLLLSLPLIIFTFGLFILVINAVLLYFVGWLMNSFDVDSFGAAFWGGLIISLVSVVTNAFLGTSRVKVQVRRGPRRRRTGRGRDDDPGGPVIDV